MRAIFIGFTLSLLASFACQSGFALNTNTVKNGLDNILAPYGPNQTDAALADKAVREQMGELFNNLCLQAMDEEFRKRAASLTLDDATMATFKNTVCECVSSDDIYLDAIIAAGVRWSAKRSAFMAQAGDQAKNRCVYNAVSELQG